MLEPINAGPGPPIKNSSFLSQVLLEVSHKCSQRSTWHFLNTDSYWIRVLGFILDMPTGGQHYCRTLLPLLGIAVHQTLLVPYLSSAALFGQVLWFLTAHRRLLFTSHQTATAKGRLKASRSPKLPGGMWKSRGNASDPFTCYFVKGVSKSQYLTGVLMKILVLPISYLITFPFLLFSSSILQLSILLWGSVKIWFPIPFKFWLLKLPPAMLWTLWTQHWKDVQSFLCCEFWSLFIWGWWKEVSNRA